MAAMNAAGREQLLRVARIVITGLLTQPAVASLFASTAARYPLTVLVIAAVEVIYHAVKAPREVVVPGSAAPTVLPTTPAPPGSPETP